LLLLLSVVGADPPSPVPVSVQVITSRGEQSVTVHVERGHPALAAGDLESLLPLTSRTEGEWGVVEFAGQPFRFLLNAPLVVYSGSVVPLAGGAYVTRDSLFVPLQWLAVHVPRMFHEAYRYDVVNARFAESRFLARATVSGTVEPDSDVPAEARALGLVRRHRVVVDAGHGGRHPGTSGGGLQEKNLALAIARQVELSLKAKGVDVLMTRTSDVLIPLEQRAPMCDTDCDLFVSIHVNALPSRPGSWRINGFETYFFDHSRQGAPDRVAILENSISRYEEEEEPEPDDGAVGSILRDMEENEYIRESAALADIIREYGGRVHPNGARRVAQDNFAVLRLATRPAVLVETGYITNSSDRRFLSSPDGQRQLGEAIADGVVEYLRRYETKVEPRAQR
ncbi:MAG: N-acetylmuramoyl-L-alanine amidase, partial [Gemmatimonadota bacterium]|nr:N-acetylmuramoyl-L-alanine amidase [Gemmatimonadota bacterium]